MSEVRRLRVVVGERTHEVEVDVGTDPLTVRVDGREMVLRPGPTGWWRVDAGGEGPRSACVVRDQDRWLGWLDGLAVEGSVTPASAAALAEATRRAAGPSSGSRSVLSPMPGRVVKTLVAPGDAVEAGAALLIVEAMKMENEVQAPRAGLVAEVAVQPGQAVDGGQLLVTLMPHADADS